MPIRLCKTALVAATSFFLLLVVFNNLTDYESNHQFVQHVLKMDTTFPGNAAMGRAVNSSAVHTVFYASIILWEAITGVLVGLGTLRLIQSLGAADSEWQKAKTLALVGMTGSLLQWFVAFISVGGEWFLMWQSKIWNGQEAAFRMFAIIGIALVFLCQREE